MSWRVTARPEVEDDAAQAAEWYEKQRRGLGLEMIRAVERVFRELAENPYLNSERHRRKHIRIRLTERFPYRVIYRVEEETRSVMVIAVLHAKRHDRHWRKRT